MFTKPTSLVLFHGTGAHFECFDDTSMSRGIESEPNNRFGVWSCQDAREAVEYARYAGAEDDFPGVLVLEVDIAPGQIRAECINLDDLVTGNLAGANLTQPMGRVFDDALEAEGPEYDAGAAYVRAREALLADGCQAMWIETGEVPIMAVFDPTKITIRARLTLQEAMDFADALESEWQPGANDLTAADVESILEDILDARFATSSLMRP